MLKSCPFILFLFSQDMVLLCSLDSLCIPGWAILPSKPGIELRVKGVLPGSKIRLYFYLLIPAQLPLQNIAQY